MNVFFDKTIPIVVRTSAIKTAEIIPESPVDGAPVMLWYCGVAKVSVVEGTTGVTEF